VTYRFDEEDLQRIQPIPIESRQSKVHVDQIVDPARSSGKSGDFVSTFPDILGAASFKQVVAALRTAREAKNEIIWLIGAHTIKTGLSLYLNRLIEHGFITTVSTTGSAIIHDLELAFFGATSEDVAQELPAGRFGMSAETSAHFNAACAFAAENDFGLGNGVGAYIESQKAPHANVSVFAGAHRNQIPATAHVAFGTDITHQHPTFDAETVGALTMRDFRILTARVGRAFDHGVVVIFGSAVILPEVFLKTVSINYNLGRKPSGVTAVSFDMLPQYRVRENVLARPFRDGGTAHAITGHHEIMLPLLYHSLLG